MTRYPEAFLPRSYYVRRFVGLTEPPTPLPTLPPEFPGYAGGFDIDPMYNVFSDEGGTSPTAVNGDAVRVDDAVDAAKAVFFTSFNLARMKLRQAGDGLRYLEIALSPFSPNYGGGHEHLTGQSGTGINQDLSECSVYYVVETNSRAAFQAVVSFGNQYEGVFGSQEDGSINIYANLFAGGSLVSSSNGGLPRYTMEYGRNAVGICPGPSKTRFNTPRGISTVNTSPGAGMRTGCRIFVNGAGNNNGNPSGKIFRILVFNAVHTAVEQDRVISYLQSTYSAILPPRDMDEDCVFLFGNSRSFGQQHSIALDLLHTSVPDGVQFRNLSVGGSSATSLTARLSELTDQFSTTAKNIVVLWEGVNAAYSEADLDVLFALSDTIREFPNTWTIGCSEIPNYATADTARIAYNAKHDAEWEDHFDRRADFQLEPTIGVRQGSQPSVYADGVHLNDSTLLGAILAVELEYILALVAMRWPADDVIRWPTGEIMYWPLSAAEIYSSPDSPTSLGFWTVGGGAVLTAVGNTVVADDPTLITSIAIVTGAGVNGTFDFSEMPSLDSVNIDDIEVTSMDVSDAAALTDLVITNCPSLVELVADSASIVEVLVDNCPALTSVSFDGATSLTDLTLADTGVAFIALSLTSLVNLDVSGSPAEEVAITCPALETLDCSGCASLAIVFDLTLSPLLVDLDFSGTSLAEVQLDAILAGLVDNGLSSGTLNLLVLGGVTPSDPAGLADKATLEGLGWTVNTN